MNAPVLAVPAASARRRPGALTGVRREAPGAVLALVGLTVLGAVLRVVVAHQSLFADELSTTWIVWDHGLRGVVSTVHSDAEITPPLYFVAAWVTSKLGHTPEAIRLPSLIAGTATIPLVYVLGRQVAGRFAALVAAALTTLSPFMVYYSAEARAYGVMMALVVLSTVAMLRAVETRRVGWWALYAAASCLAMYTHYTCAFALAAQLLWLLWAHPEARIPALAANVVAAVAFAPWLGGLLNDLSSPTSKILSALSPFTPRDVAADLGHWAIGYPYANLALADVPGWAGLALIALGVAGGVAGLAGRRRPRRWTRAPEDRRLLLVAALALSVPVGEAVVSAVGTNLFGVRNLAASWPAAAVLVGAVLAAGPPRWRLATTALVVAGFAVSAALLLEPSKARPDYAFAARYVERHAAPGDVVLDETGILSPGPLTGLDVTLKGDHRVLRGAAPAERDHPFNLFDRVIRVREAIPRATALARGHRVIVVSDTFTGPVAAVLRRRALQDERFPAGWRRVRDVRRPGSVGGVRVRIYARG